MHRRIFSAFVFSCIALLATTVVVGQATGGSVTGTVTDSTGAIIQNATVTLESKTTGQKLTTQTTGSGSYSFPNVPVGDYRLTINATGFRATSTEVKLFLNQTTSADLAIEAGAVEESVTVTAAGEALVQTDTSQLGKSYEERLVKNLPIFGNQNALALLSANVVDRSSGVLGSGGSVGGTRARSNVFIVDGVDNNDPSVTGPAVDVITDAVQEFTLLTNNYNAEFGAGGGGQFVTITKSGTNEFHGSGFAFLQHQQLNAASSSEEAQLKTGQLKEKPRFRNTIYGATIGGPIIKNKLFFFGAFQRTHNSEEGASTTFLSPTTTGFGQIASLPAVSPYVLNLLRNNLSLAAIQTTTQTVLGVSGIPFGDVSLNIPVGFQDKKFQINIDHLRGSKDQFRYRFNYGEYAAEQAGGGSPSFNNLNTYDTKSFSATWVRTFSDSLVNDLRLAWRQAINDFPLKDPANLTFPNLTVRPLNLNLGPNGNLPQSGGDNVYQVVDNVSLIRGSHSFKFGGEYKRILTTSNFLARERGDYIYNTLDELLQDLTPVGRNGLRGVGSGTFTGNVTKFYLFGQDDWKVTPNLTLNLGLRYERSGVPRASAEDVPYFQGVSVPGLNFQDLEADKNNFGPRLGFAWAPGFESGLFHTLFGDRGRSSIRVNFSMTYSDFFQNLALFSRPPQIQQELDVGAAVARLGLQVGPGFLQRGGLPATPIPPTSIAAIRAGVGGITDSQSLVLPETYSFAVSWQRELSPSMAVEIRYLGTRSRHLPIQIPRNLGYVPISERRMPTFLSQPTASQLAGLPTYGDLVFASPNALVQPYADEGFFGGVTAFHAEGNSNYDSGSISLTRRFSRGLAFTTAYTYSKSIDNSTNELFSSVVNPRRPQDYDRIDNERSLSALDIPHRFVFAGNYELPWFKKSSNGFVRAVLGGLELAGIFQAQSGQPWTPLSGIDTNQNFDAAPDRAVFNPSGVPGTGSRVCAINAAGQLLRAGGSLGPGSTTNPDGSPVTLATCTIASYSPTNAVGYVAVNPNAQYLQAGPMANANAGRNTLRAKGFNRTDLTLISNLRFGEEKYNLQIGAEAFNVFNQRIRTIASVGPTNTGFVNVNSTRFNDYSLGVVEGRTIQMRIKLIF
jgi:hypothetical protein